MKFKNSLAKKLIIALIILVLFNSIYPTMSYAVDFGGILLQPIYWMLLSIYIPIDIAAGTVIQLGEFAMDTIHGHTEAIMSTKPDGWVGALATVESALSSLFIGPDTIFKRRNCII